MHQRINFGHGQVQILIHLELLNCQGVTHSYVEQCDVYDIQNLQYHES